MANILKQMLKNVDPDVELNKLFTSYEDSMFNQSADMDTDPDLFNNQLDTDRTFDNAFIENNKTDEIMTILTLGNDFKFDTPGTLNKCTNSQNTENSNMFKERTTFQVCRVADTLNKPFLRFKLKDGLEEQQIHKLISLLADCSISLEIGGAQIVKINKLLFLFLICDELKKPIQTFDMKEFYKNNSNDEIMKMCKTAHQDRVSFNFKYMCNNNTDKYLDIPLLFDFFMYGTRETIVAMQYHYLRYNFEIPSHRLEEFKLYVDSIHVSFEEVTNIEQHIRKQIAQSTGDYIILQPKTLDYLPNYVQSQLTIRSNDDLKFIYIIMRSDNSDCSTTDFPSIEKCETDTGEIYDPCLFYVADFEKYRIYGISADTNCDMKDWVEFKKESINDLESDRNSQIANTNTLSNYNEKYYSKFKTVNSTTFIIRLSPYTTPINIEIVPIYQNIKRVQSGMCGVYKY
jgi:hypothetical protein